MKKLLLFQLILLLQIHVSAQANNGLIRFGKQLLFIENKGQVLDQSGNRRSDIQYKLEGQGVNVFVGGGEIHYQWNAAVSAAPGKIQMRSHLIGSSALKDMPAQSAEVKYCRMDVALIGADKNAEVVAEGVQHYYERYYLPGISENGVIAHSYKKITYKNVYPGIDWVFRIVSDAGGNEKLEYDFIVHPGGKVSDIRISYQGAASLKLDKDGGLIATSPMGHIQEDKPISFTADGVCVASVFVLNNNVLTFKTAPYSGDLTIDPSIVWATYYGGNTAEQDGVLRPVDLDPYGNVYMAGMTASAANIATSGSWQSSFNAGGSDAFLVKFNAAGQRIWGTYYGGPGSDICRAVACDRQGNVYICGETKSVNNIATPGAYQPVKAGMANSYDAFLVKFDSSGVRAWGTYYGGAGEEAQINLCCDLSGNIYLTGRTGSTADIASPGAHQLVFGGGSEDAFLAKFDGSGQRKWSTYYGGSNLDVGWWVTCDKAGMVYMSGSSASADGIATPGCFNPDGDTDNGNGFLVKLDSLGNMRWGTYYGGAVSYDEGRSCACDDSGNVYMAGPTGSSAGIASPGCYQPAIAGGVDAYIVRFDSTGNRQWGTYFGGANDEECLSVACSGYGHLYVSGFTQSTGGIAVTGNGIQNTFAGGFFDGYLIRLTNAGVPDLSTYYGGIDLDGIAGTAPDDSGHVYISGFTNSNGLATPGSQQPTMGGGMYDGFLTKLCLLPVSQPLITTDSVCSGSTRIYSVSLPGADSYIWSLPPGWAGSSTANTISVTAPVTSGSGTITVKAVKCNDTGLIQTIEVYVRPPLPALITVNGFVLGTVNSHTTYQWYLNGLPLPGATGSTYTVTQNGDYTVKTTDAYGCGDSSSVYTVMNVAVSSLESLAKAVLVYPNPANEIIHIVAPVSIDISISSLDGRLVLKQNDVKTIDIKNLPEGIYMLMLRAKDGRLVKTEKLIRL